MNDRVEMLEATLDLIDGGVAILDSQSNILFWNKAATTLTGYLPCDLVAQPCPEDLFRVNAERKDPANIKSDPCSHARPSPAVRQSGEESVPCTNQTALLESDLDAETEADRVLQCLTLVSMNHKLGHSVPGMLRKAALLDSFGEPAGTALLFYPVEDVDSLPHGELGEGANIERSQTDMEDRLEAAYHQWRTGGMPFGLLWITVDQAESLRSTHGRDACESMLRTVEQTLLHQMKPTEILGRWGNNEFLALAHERSAKLMLEHGRRLAGLARTADFRWWGDRVALTLSVGASHAESGDTLLSLLNRARQAMRSSAYAGGNQVTEAREI